MIDIKKWCQFRRDFGNKIHEQRMKKKMTLRKLSLLTNLSEKTLDQIELGKHPCPLYLIHLIYDALGMKL